jgi:hypothetical protein
MGKQYLTFGLAFVSIHIVSQRATSGSIVLTNNPFWALTRNGTIKCKSNATISSMVEAYIYTRAYREGG